MVISMNSLVITSALLIIIAHLRNKELETSFSKKENMNTLKISRASFCFSNYQELSSRTTFLFLVLS